MSVGGLVAVHQVVAGCAPRDAISQHVLAAQELFRGWGLRSEVYAGAFHPDLTDRVHAADTMPGGLPADELLVVHYSIDSPAFGRALTMDARLAMHYHNITPPRFLWRYAPAVARECAAGRDRLPAFARRVEASWADSGFNALELEELGFPRPSAVGILTSPSGVVAAGPAAAERRPGPPRLLFVGRGIPNKAQHDLVLALAALHESGLSAELTLVGGWDAAPDYRRDCMAMAERLGVAGACHVVGSVDDAALVDAYRDADVFVCLSDHEGFCVPLLEAMAADLPIVAYAAGAVPETVGDAGVLLPEKPPSLVAEAVMAVLDRPGLRDAMAAARGPRLAELSPQAVAGRMRSALEALT